MITKGIITAIDLTGNTCKVRMPLFETAGNDPIIGDATISNTPGSYNGYKVNDVVWVAFEDGQMDTPVVIGKLYLGVEREKSDPRGVLNVVDSSVSKSATIPADTKLGAELDKNVPNTTVPYNSLFSIATNVSALRTDVDQNDRFYNNKFTSIINGVDEWGNKLSSIIEQTEKDIRAEVKGKVPKYSSDDAEYETGFGWDLTARGWNVYRRSNKDDKPNSENLFVSIKAIKELGHGTYFFTNSKY